LELTLPAFLRFATDARAPEKEAHDAGAERFVPELFRADSSWTHFETPTEDGRTINRANLTINRVNPVIGRWEKTLDWAESGRFQSSRIPLGGLISDFSILEGDPWRDSWIAQTAARQDHVSTLSVAVYPHPSPPSARSSRL